MCRQKSYLSGVMIKNLEELRKFEADYLRRENLTMEQRLAILDGLYEMARLFGHFNGKDVLDGIENDIKLAKAINTDVSFPPH